MSCCCGVAIIAAHSNACVAGNRAFANLKLENYGLAIADATKALELDPSYLKGYYRRGAAYMALSKFKDARAEFRAVVKLRPRDKDARKKLAQCDKEVKREAFEAAIAVEDEPPVSETINVEDIAVPDSYTGPRIPETGIDRDFVIQLMQHFKDQKGLHKKYALQILIELRALLKELPSLLDVRLFFLPLFCGSRFQPHRCFALSCRFRYPKSSRTGHPACSTSVVTRMASTMTF